MSHAKNKAFNRALALLLSVMMVVAMLPASTPSVFAASVTHPNVFTITVKEGENPVHGASVILSDESGHSWTKTTDDQGVAAFEEFTQKGKGGEISGQVSYTVSADTYESKVGIVENAEADEWIGNIDIALSKASVAQKKVTVDLTGSGTATVKLNGAENKEISVNQGSEVTLEIVPEEGAYIKSVSAADVSKIITDDQKYSETLTVSDDISVSVVVNKRHTVSIDKNEGGTVTLNGSNETILADNGSEVQLSVQASEGYQISSVKIGDDNEPEHLTDNTSFTKLFSVEKDTAVEVRFVKVYVVHVEYTGNGQVEINGNSVTSGGEVTVKENEEADKITVKAQPSEGCRVRSVSINDTPVTEVTGDNDSGFQKELDKTKDYSIVIIFAPNVYTVSVQKVDNGSVNVEGSYEVEYDGSKTVYLVPDDGFTVESVTVNKSTEIENIVNDEKGIHFEINNIKEDKSIEVSFKEKSKALASDVSIDKSSSALRKNEDATLFIIKKDSSIEFSTEKDGLRLYDSDGKIIGGSISEQSVLVSKSVIVKRIQLYYMAEGELYADWHDVEMEDKEIEVVVDETNPTATIESVPPANEWGYHKSDVVLKVFAEDPGKFSGIQKIEYYVKFGSNQEATQILYEHGDGDIQNTFSKDDAIKIDAATHNRNDISVVLTVTDIAGNTFIATQELKINSTQPTVTLSLDGTKNVGANNDVFNGKRTLKIIVNDRGDTFDRDAVAKGLKITRDGQPVTVNTEDISWNGDESPYIGTYTFQEDGVYDWSLSYTNKADYDAKISLTEEDDGTFYRFKIDTETPYDLKVSYEPTFKEVALSTLTFGFYNPSVKVKIEAKDDTAGIEKFEYSYVVQEGASTVNEGKEKVVVDSSNDNFELSDDGVASVTFEIPAQFRGQVSFKATDKGGNASELLTDGRLIIVDTIAPGVTVSYNDDAEAVNEEYYTSNRTATIEIDEANFFGTSEYNQADFYDVIPDKENNYLEILVGKTTDDGIHTDTKQYPVFSKNGDKYIATISFNEDADYTLTIQYTDRSGNEAVISDYQKEFTIDKIAPAIEVSFRKDTALNEIYFGANREATIKVTEHNFDATTFSAGVVRSGSPMADYDTYLQNDSNWQHDGDVHTATIEFAVDGHYSFAPICSDKAGNPNETVQFIDSVAPDQFVVDKVAPKQDSMKITYSKSVLDTVLETFSFGFYKAPVTVTIEAEDETSEIDYFTYTYAVSDGVSTKNHGKEDQRIEHAEITPSGNSASATFQIPAQFRGKVSFVATDMAGNSEDKADDKVIVVDDIAPGITVSYDNNDVRNEKYYDKDRIATITIDEANFFGDTEWSAKDLYDLIPETDKEYLAISVTKRLLNSSKTTTTKMYPEFTKAGDIYTATIEFKENAEYKFEIEYTDRSGNVGSVAEYQKEFVINKESPKLSISYDNMDALNDTYYKVDRVATIHIAESTFRASEVDFTISATDVTGKIPVDLSSKAYDTYLKDQNNWTESELNVWTAQIPLDIEGNYNLNLKYTNLAGTPQEKEVTDSFCIDKSDPNNLKISYEPDFVGVLLETLTFGFYKAPVKAMLEATDDFAGVDYFVYSYTVQENTSKKNVGKTGVKTSESQLSREGNKASTTFEIPAQFRGFVSFDVFDKSGNKKSLADGNAVVVDNVAPVINVTYDNNDAVYEKYYNNDRVATITIDEANFFEDDLTKDNLLVITVDKTTDAGVHTTEKVKPTFSKDGDVYTGTVEFRENADYKFTIEYTDRSGNAAVIGQYQSEFTIDKTAPKIKVTYDNNNSKNGDQFKEDRTATIVITEHNFKPSDVIAKVVGSGSEIKRYADYLKVEDNWTSIGDVHTAAIQYNEEAHYEFSIAYADMAGNVNTPVDYADSVAPEKFTLDKSAPTQLTITIDSKSVLGNNSIAFDTFYDKAVSVKLAANCNISGLESLKYQKVSSAPEYDPNGQWIDYNAETGIVVSPSEKFIIYFRAEDRAGNYAIVNSTGIVVDDKMPEGTDEKNAPEIDIRPAASNANGFHNGNVTVDLHVIDPKYSGQRTSATGFYSGLKKITYRIYTTDMGADIQETGTLFELGSQTNGATFDNDRLVSSWSGSITIDANKFNSNNTIVEVTAEDNAGNARVTTTKAGDIRIDVTPPRIDVSYNNNAVDSDSFFKTERTATIVVTERNFDPKDVNVMITNTDGVIPVLSDWSRISAGSGNQDDTTWSTNITYSADGDYTFDITYTDLANNFMSGVSYGDSIAPTEFTIDKTLPTISVSYSNNDVANGKYFKAARTATVTINEHNFDVNRVIFTRNATLDGAAISLPNISWSDNGNVHTATISYTADGDYTFDVTMSDLAGNQSAAADYGNSAASKEFTVDQTISKPMITGIEDGHAYKDDVIPGISFSDINYDSYEVKLTRTRKDEIGVDVTEQYIDTISVDAKGGSRTFDAFQREIENDGIYTLTVRMLDKAGNEETQTLTFTVNRFGSVYEYDGYLVSLIQDGGTYVASISDDLIITEYNANRLVNDSLNIEITLDGRSIDAAYVSNPTPNENVNVGESGWFQYQYIISKENFSNDGMYRITLSSEDEASNTPESTPDNSTDENGNAIVDTMQFRVDSTAPEITSIVGLEDRIINEQKVDIRYTVYDAIALKTITVYLDGEVQDSITSFDDVNNYSGTFTINESSSAQKVRILVEDKAGNTMDTDNFGKEDADGNIIVPMPAYAFNNTVTVSTNFFVRWYANKPLFWGSIGGVIAVMAGIWLLIVLLKKKKSEVK